MYVYIMYIIMINYYVQLSGCWLCLRLDFGSLEFSIEGRLGLPSVTKALATANPAD